MLTIEPLNRLSKPIKAAIVIVLLGLHAFNVVGQTYSYSPTMNTPTNCGSGTSTLNTINYSGCYSDAGTTAYTNGNVQVAIISHNTSTGNMTFRISKCSLYFTNGTSGKLFIRQGPDVYCSSYSITNTTTSYKDITINYPGFTGLRQFEAYIINSTQTTKLFAGIISITGSNPSYYLTVTNPTTSSAWSVGNSYTIQWNDNISENVKINLNKGGLFVSTITSSTPSNGSFSWTPPTNLATGNDYEIRIVSVNTTSVTGSSGYFTINGVAPYCSGTTTLTASSGSFNDGSGSNDYVNNSDCKWLIQPTGASSISLTFNSFATESGNDFVNVYNGSTTGAPLLGTYSGATIPSVINSTGSSMLVSFVTDGNTASAGWSATYTSAEAAPNLVLQSNIGFGITNLSTGTNYTFNASIKNNGSTSWTGCFFLKQGTTNWVAINSTTIAAGSTANISGNYTPDSPGANLPLTLNYQTACAGGGTVVTAGNFSNPIYVNVTTTPITCTFTDCSSSTNCGTSNYQDQTFAAIQYLCDKNIVKGSNGSVLPNNDITRAQLAKMTLYGVFGDSLNVPAALVSDFFPCPYADLQITTTYYYRAAKALMYLEYENGIAPFDRDRFFFDPDGTISRRLVLKVMLEAFNIAPSTSTTSVFTDFAPTDNFYGYAKKAKELGITTATNFRPEESCTRAEAFIFLHKIMTLVGWPAVKNNLDISTSSFFIPINMSIASMAANKGMESGNFNMYTKSCFAIPGRNMSLDFDFTYNSYTTELPSELFPLEPLGKAWSHTYNMYMNFIYGPTVYDTKFAVHMPDGSVLIYKLDSNNNIIAETEGNYNTLTNISSTKYEFKTKSQVVYTFQKLGTNDIAFVLTSINDRNANTVTINYIQGENYILPGTSTVKATRKISAVSDPSGRTLHFTYQTGTNLIASVSDPLNRNIQFNYTSGQLTKYIDAKSQNTTYTYGTSVTESGLLTSIQLPKGNAINNLYQQRKLTSTKYNTNSPTTITHNPNYVAGNTNFYKSTVSVPQQGSQNITTNYEINKKGSITKADGNNAVNLSSSYTNSTHPTLPSAITNNLNSVTVTPTYDPSGNVTQITTSGNGITISEKFQYNSYNDVTQHTDANNLSTYYYYTNNNLSKIKDALGNETNIVNNGYGLPTSITNPSGVAVNFGYNSYGNQNQVSIPALNLTANMNYDAASRLTSTSNFSRQTTTYVCDNNDNLVSEQDAMSNNTSYAYDSNDNLTGITNAKGDATNFSYDNITDWLLTESFQAATKTYAYNNDGSMKTFTNPNGNVFSYSYDNSGRVTNDGYATYSYLSNGNLAAITKGGKAITFGYDGLNRVNNVNYDGNTVSYIYDNLGNVLTMTYPGNKVVTYSYDATNKLKTVKDWNNNTTTYTYRPDGQLENTVYSNSVSTSYTYDNAGRQTAMSTKRNNGSGTVIAEYAFTLDPIGNHTQESIIEQYTSYPALTSQTTNYTYNNANRIQNAGSVSFGFDNNGNTTSKTAYTYKYDELNCLTSVSGNLNATYAYDGASNRREATRNGVVTKYVLDVLGMSNVLMESDGSGTARNYYVYGLGLISRIKADNSTEYYIYDYRGSTVAMTDATAAANITHKYQYDDFGKVIQIQESDNNPFRYVGKYGVMYEDSTLQFMRARYYDNSIGRFLSEDPIWSVNLYPYANNNPVNKIDPEGNEDFLVSQLYSIAKKYLIEGKSYTYKDWENFMFKELVKAGVKITASEMPISTALAGYDLIIGKKKGAEAYAAICEGIAKDVANYLMPGYGKYVVDAGVYAVGFAYDQAESNLLNAKNYNGKNKELLKKIKSDPKKYKGLLEIYYSGLK